MTCTDMTVLSGNFPEVCFAKYGSVPLKAKYLHEMSLRILLHAIDAAANKYKRHIVPWLSMSVDFYVRVFVRVFECPAEVKNSCLKRAMLLQSTQSPSFYLQPLAQASTTKNTYSADILRVGVPSPGDGGNLKLAGPFWVAPIHDQDVIDALLQRVESEHAAKSLAYPLATAPRLIGLLTTMAEELKDIPFYYTIPDLAATLRCTVPTQLQMRSAVINAGYRVSAFHHEADALKTDAPDHVVGHTMPLLPLLTVTVTYSCLVVRFGTSCAPTASSIRRKGARKRIRRKWRRLSSRRRTPSKWTSLFRR